MVAMMLITLLGAGPAAGQTTSAVSRELLDLARARGSLRVVVQLKTGTGADAVAIEAAKQALWIDLAGTSYRVIRDLPDFPAVALDASAEALTALAASPRVSHVSEDLARLPQRQGVGGALPPQGMGMSPPGSR